MISLMMIHLIKGFNTQPPEGGWITYPISMLSHNQFQHTAARRRLAPVSDVDRTMGSVSTHSRPKAAGQSKLQQPAQKAVSTHSRPKAAGVTNPQNPKATEVSTHSRPKAAGSAFSCMRGGNLLFQHTAARRRLGCVRTLECQSYHVSTHSRPKAAGFIFRRVLFSARGFNTQPPEGGWNTSSPRNTRQTSFQHTAARRRLETIHEKICRRNGVSTHSRPKAAGDL